MNLQSSINENQNALLELYILLKQRFTENSLILALWEEMERDIGQQIRNLKALPPSFWRQLKQAAGIPAPAATGTKNGYNFEKEGVISIQRTFEIALAAEEPLILESYVPIIRTLRRDRTGAALDFYILVKAHLARIVRITESFAGDPLLIQRANRLLQGFEKEVQDRQEELPPPVNRILAGPAGQKRKPAENKAKPATAAPKSPAKTHRNPPKTLAKKADLQRRRARR